MSEYGAQGLPLNKTLNKNDAFSRLRPHQNPSQLDFPDLGQFEDLSRGDDGWPARDGDGLHQGDNEIWVTKQHQNDTKKSYCVFASFPKKFLSSGKTCTK